MTEATRLHGNSLGSSDLVVKLEAVMARRHALAVGLTCAAILLSDATVASYVVLSVPTLLSPRGGSVDHGGGGGGGGGGSYDVTRGVPLGRRSNRGRRAAQCLHSTVLRATAAMTTPASTTTHDHHHRRHRRRRRRRRRQVGLEGEDDREAGRGFGADGTNVRGGAGGASTAGNSKSSKANSELPALLRQPPGKAVMSIAVPTMAIGLLRTLYSLTDAFFVGKLGAIELEAMGATR